MNFITFFVGWACFFLTVAVGIAGQPPSTPAREAKAALLAAMREEHAWIKVHAAEALLAEGISEPVRTLVAAEPEAGGGDFPRIGLWRIRISLAKDEEERAKWAKRVEAVFLDPVAQPDRLQALETLGKIRHRASGALLDALHRMAVEAPEKDRVMAQWVLVLAGEENALAKLTDYLGSKEPIARQRAAYAMKWLKATDPVALKKLARAADAEPADSPGMPYIVSAAFTLKALAARASAWQAKLEAILDNGDGATRFEACQALMEVYPLAEAGRLTAYFHATGDSRIGPAWLTLHIMRPTMAKEPEA